jgi:predicted permease
VAAIATAIREIRLAFRRLRKAPGFALAVVLTLAVGTGATIAIFSLVEGILLRPLPFADPERLVLLGDHLGNGPNTPVTAREISEYSNETKVFSSMGGYIGASYELSGGALPEMIDGSRLTAGVFPTLGVEPMLGRVFTAQEENAHAPVAVISYAMWLNRYHRDAKVLGSTIALDRKAYSIIGVMPRSFAFPLQAGRLNQVQLWVPLSLTAVELSDSNAGMWGYHIVARLKDGVTPAQAASDADRVAKHIMRNFPAGMSALHIRGDVESVRENAVGDVRPLLRTLFLAVAVVLVIACANVSGLLLVRAIRRRREYAVRLALGASSGVILRESVFEGVLLSLMGGLLGLGLAAVAIRTALHLLPESMPRVDSISIDSGVALFALLISLATGVFCGAAPAFAALRTNVIDSLKQGSLTSSAGASHAWLRSTLVVGEIAITLLLLSAAGAFLASLEKMRAVDPGFRTDHVLTAGYQLPIREYPTSMSANVFSRALIERLAAKPAVVAVAVTSILPGSGGSAGSAFTLEGEPVATWKLKFASFTTIQGDYFRAMNIRLLEGRTFNDGDRADTMPVVIVNQAMADHSWPGQSAIGKRMHAGNPKKQMPWATVVGVVANTKAGPRDEPDDDQWYIPDEQPATLMGTAGAAVLTRPAGGNIVLRSALPPEQMKQILSKTTAELDPLLALDSIQPMDDVVANVEAPRRFNTGIIGAFATGAVLLAITGIYAVMAFSVSLRTQEIAIRMALGAKRSGITRLVLLSATRLTLVGCGLGVLGSLAVSRLVSSFLFGVSATDPRIYIASVIVMTLIALLASALPAMRAASIDPVKALRS